MKCTEWLHNPEFTAMVNTIISVATNQKTMVLGLSIQDYNLQTVFSKAKQIRCMAMAISHRRPRGIVFCGDQITNGQNNVLKIVYGNAYDLHATEIQAATHVRAWAEQILIALVLQVLTDKLALLMASRPRVVMPSFTARNVATILGRSKELHRRSRGA